MNDQIKELAKLINNSKNVVFFGGAGTSTDSGIKDFRGKDGLYKTTFKGYAPEEVLSIDFFNAHKDLFLEYVNDKLNINGIKPNKGHFALVELEKMGKLKTIITQNIDDLHQQAGSKNVLELHGTLKDWYCLSCGTHKDHYFNCQCGGIVRPRVTLYGEMLDANVTYEAIDAIKNCDLLIVAGTSLTVYPANSYVGYCNGPIVIINDDPTQYDNSASMVIHGNFADTMDQVVKILKDNTK